MRSVLGRVMGAVAVVALLATGVLLAAGGAGAATAAAPAGPRLALVAVAKRLAALTTVDQHGRQPLRLAGGGPRTKPYVDTFSPPSWSLDGKQIAFAGITGFDDGDDHEAVRRIFVVRADGSGLRPIRGTNGASFPVFSPDGLTVAFTRALDRETPTKVGGKLRQEFHGSSVWLIDFESGKQRQLTPWRDGVKYQASSFSPDGSTLLATHEDDRLLNEPEPVALQVDGGGSRRLFADGSSPVYSPDGSEIVFNRGFTGEAATDGDLFVIPAAGGKVRRLTNTPARSEFSASWDPSGERLVYSWVQAFGSADEGLAFGAGLIQVNADGSCPEKLTLKPAATAIAVAWQPGPGRGLGRIEC